MQGLTADLLSQACRTFLALAYAQGNVPGSKRIYLEVNPSPPLHRFLAPPVCQSLVGPEGQSRGYSIRLGCSWFPHVKLQVIECGAGSCVFSVDTHDAMEIAADHPDALGVAALQGANRHLKQKIERAWEAEGLRTFHSVLRDGLDEEGARGQGPGTREEGSQLEPERHGRPS
jgi:hypothetical protein